MTLTFLAGAIAIWSPLPTASGSSRDVIFLNFVETRGRCAKIEYGPRPTPKEKAEARKIAAQIAAGKAVAITPGSRCLRYFFGKRTGKYLPNKPPTIELLTSLDGLRIVGTPGGASVSSGARNLKVKAVGFDPDGDQMMFTFSATGGQITANGADASWDLSGQPAGSYTITGEVDDGCGCLEFASATVTIGARD